MTALSVCMYVAEMRFLCLTNIMQQVSPRAAFFDHCVASHYKAEGNHPIVMQLINVVI